MQDVIIKVSPQDIMRMKAIDIDNDRDDALALIRDFLSRAEASLNSGIKNHLDK